MTQRRKQLELPLELPSVLPSVLLFVVLLLVWLDKVTTNMLHMLFVTKLAIVPIEPQMV